jgi:hypothetical protein
MAAVDNSLLLLPRPERVSELQQSSTQEDTPAVFWNRSHLPQDWAKAMLSRSLADNEGVGSSEADVSEWSPELDGESRAIHKDFAQASFRALIDD